MNPCSSSASRAIGRFVQEFEGSELGADALHAARRAFLDTFGGAIAGSREPASLLIERYCRSVSPDNGTATVWSRGGKLSTEAAALVNGAMAHVLDYDDVLSPMRGHPSVVMFPALVALAEAEEKRWADVFVAFAVGLEVLARLGRAVAVDHVAKGWHSTNTLGVFGAVAACCKLLGLTSDQTVSALGLALAQAAGTRTNFGSMAKCFQAGQAAFSAVRATRLAQMGFTAGADPLGDPHGGFSSLYCSGESLVEALEGLGVQPLEIVTGGVDVKKYPNCYATHRAIDGVLDVRDKFGLTLCEVDRIEVRASRNAFVPLVHDRPVTALEGKFSLQYALAAALQDGRVGLSTFTDSMVLREEIQAALPKIVVVGYADPPLPRWVEFNVVLRSGRVISHRVEALRGSAAAPLTDAELIAKFVDCCDYSGAGPVGSSIAQTLLEVDSEQVGSSLPQIARVLGGEDVGG